MQSVPREWLDFLRQQFPKDSRIQLTEISGLKGYTALRCVRLLKFNRLSVQL